MTLEYATRYISKAGDDLSGDGSQAAPFQTIHGAASSIADASQLKPYALVVGAGDFEMTPLPPWMYLRGAGRDVTTLSDPTGVNLLGSSYGATGSQEGGIANCGFAATATVDFQAVGSPGAGRFHLDDCACAGGSLVLVGSNALNRVTVSDLSDNTVGSVHTISITNLQARLQNVSSAAMTLIVSCTGAVASGVVADSWQGSISITGNGSAYAAYTAGNTLTSTPSLVGDRVFYNPGKGAMTFMFGPDADTQYVWGVGTVVPGAIALPNSGRVFILAPLTAQRTYTLNGSPPNTNVTELEIYNGVNAPLLVTPGTGAPGMQPRTLSPGATGRWRAAAGALTPNGPRYESGFVTLAAGLSPFIPCDNPQSAPGTTLSQPVIVTQLFSAGGTSAGGAQRIVGAVNLPANLGGGFQIESLVSGPGFVRDLGDDGVYMWTLIGVGQ